MADEELFDPWTHEYALLGLRLDRIHPGTVDAWIGPPEWRESVLAEEAPQPERLLRDACSLEERLPAMGYDSTRETYLALQMAGLRAQAEIAIGTEIPFAEQARRFFDIEPERQPESNFEAAHAQLEAILPGTGPLLDRMTAWRESLQLTGERVLTVLESATEEVRRRTLTHFTLPPEERVDITLVSEKPWGAYNWYQGGYRSLIEVNTDIPRPITSAPDYMAHEGYPGHHFEHVLREGHQYRGQGRGEYAIMLINTPESVISEAVATCARDAIFPNDEDLEWLASSVTGELGLELDVDLARRGRAASRGLEGVSTNAAFLLHEDGRPAEEVAEYISRWGLIPLDQATKSLRFTQDPLWRVYPFTYRNGHALLKPLLQGSDRLDVLERVCTETVYPSLLAKWDAA